MFSCTCRDTYIPQEFWFVVTLVCILSTQIDFILCTITKSWTEEERKVGQVFMLLMIAVPWIAGIVVACRAISDNAACHSFNNVCTYNMLQLLTTNYC